MRTALAAVMLASFASVAPAGSADGAASFDARVSGAWRCMRAACRAAQQLPSAPAGKAPALERKAGQEVAKALARWTAVARDFEKTIPAGYAGDADWARRLRDVQLDLERMQLGIEREEWRSAVLSCSHAAGSLGTMHEANGVTLAVDAVVSLRRKTGYLKGLLAARKTERVPSLVGAVLSARDAVLLAPAPEGGRRRAYLEALSGLSRATDSVADAARSGGDLWGAVDTLSDLVEEIYDLAI